MQVYKHTLSPAWLARFSGIGRLYGDLALTTLAQGRFVIVGIGGVGSWAAEALARSGVGSITLIDCDTICLTNTNRQAHALESQLQQSKVSMTAARLQDINPEISVHEVQEFLTLDNMAQLITPDYHVIIDAMDMAHTKAALVAYAMARKISMVTVGSAGGKRDPSGVRFTDLARTANDPLLAKMRHDLYKNFGLIKDKKRKFRVDAIYSEEAMVYPQPDGSTCAQKQTMHGGRRLDCSSGFGSATMVTGTFGFLAASRGISRYLLKEHRLETSSIASV